MSSQADKVLHAVRRAGVLRPRDLDRYGLPRGHLSRLERAGRLERVGRGLYVLPGSGPSEHRSLTEAAARMPAGVVCLLSALHFHGLTSRAPYEVWLAVERKARRPRVDYPPLHVVRFSGAALREGVEEHVIEGVPVRVFSPAKTVADCFKYRHEVGLDIALQALRECARSRRCTADAVWHFAGICRVRNVMRPYLEVVTR